MQAALEKDNNRLSNLEKAEIVEKISKYYDATDRREKLTLATFAIIKEGRKREMHDDFKKSINTGIYPDLKLYEGMSFGDFYQVLNKVKFFALQDKIESQNLKNITKQGSKYWFLLQLVELCTSAETFNDNCELLRNSMLELTKYVESVIRCAGNGTNDAIKP